mmetsp:Transcript_34932/g.47743  ORF Transcript_34932/g.47743 Transcript_34932/m.47743 type:complete len:123 (-) Transcript_34932:57-425(-)
MEDLHPSVGDTVEITNTGQVFTTLSKSTVDERIWKDIPIEWREMSDSGYWHEVGFGAKKGLTGVVIHVWEQGIVYSQYWQDDKFSKVLLQMEHDGKVCCLPITERGVKVVSQGMSIKPAKRN